MSRKTNKKPPNPVIIVAFIGAIATILSTLINIIPQFVSDSAPPTPTQSQVASTLPSIGVETAVSTPTVSATPDVTLPIDYYFEDFSVDSGKWPTENREYEWGTVVSSINNGKFHWEASVYTDNFFHLPMPLIPIVSNFEMEVDFSLVDGLRQYGITFRRQGDSFYYFPIDHGNFGFTIWDPPSLETPAWESIVSWKSYSDIKETQPSQLRVVAQNSSFKLYINDQWVADIDDNTFDSGSVGIVIPVKSGENVQLEIDSFRLSSIQINSE